MRSSNVAALHYVYSYRHGLKPYKGSFFYANLVLFLIVRSCFISFSLLYLIRRPVPLRWPLQRALSLKTVILIAVSQLMSLVV